MKALQPVAKGVTISRKAAALLLTFEEDVRHHADLWPDYRATFEELRAVLKATNPPKAERQRRKEGRR